MRNIRRGLVPIVALSLGLAACGGSDDDTSDDSAASESDSSLTEADSGTESTDAATATSASGEEGSAESAPSDLSADLDVFWFKVNLVEQWEEVTDEFERLNPGVTITTETVGGDQQWLPLLKSKFAAGEGPDIYLVEGAAQADAFAGYMADLTNEPWVAKAYPSAVEGLTIDGVVRGMPLSLEGYGYIYNKTIFEEAGVTERPGTLSELRDAAEKIQAAGYTPFSTGYGIWWVSGNHLINQPFAYQSDPNAFMAEAKAGEINFVDQPLFQSLKDLADLTIEYGESDPLASNRDSQQLMFLDGEAAMFEQGNWREIEIQEAAPDMEFGLLPMPLTDDPEQSDRLAVGVPFYMVVNEQSSPEEQEAAKAFMNWLVESDYGQTALVDTLGFIPAYPDIEAGQLGGISDDIIEYSNAGKTIPWMFGQFPDGSSLEMSEAFQRYVAGAQDWDATLNEFNSIWERLATD